MARRKRDGKLAMVRMSWDAYNALFSFCDYSSFDFTAVAGGIISRHYKEVLTMMPDADVSPVAPAAAEDTQIDNHRSVAAPKKKLEPGESEGDEEMFYAEKLYNAISDGQDLTPKAWEWLDAYRKKHGRPPMERPSPNS